MEEAILMFEKSKNLQQLLLTVTSTFVFLFVNFVFSNAQYNNSFKAFLDTNSGLIGDHIHLKLSAEINKDYLVTFPALSDSIGKLQIIAKSKIDTIKNNNFITLNQNITITAFDSGYFQIPQLYFILQRKGDSTTIPSATDALSLTFHSVAIDTTKPIKDIKPPLDVPFDIFDYIWYFVVLILIVAGTYFGLRYYKLHKNKIQEKPKYDPKIPAHIQALLDLEKLEQERLWQNGKVKEYYSALTDIFRLYIERRFAFPALESTTNEILYQIEQFISGEQILKNLKYVLETADLVKFAKEIPAPNINDEILKLTRNIIEATIPIETDLEINKEDR
jgi:hypothetical protein